MVVVAEIAIAIAVVGWFLAPTIKELMDSARSSLGSRYKWYTGLPKKLEELAGALEEINGTVGAARENFINDPAMIDLLWGLKDAIHDAEELLDTFHYEILDANLNLEKRHPVKRAMDSTVDFGKQVIGTKKSLNKLKELLKQLGSLRQRSVDLVKASKRGSRPILRPVTAPQPRKDKLFGYDKKYEDLVSGLISGDGCSRVVAIIGHAGTGKTELARQAFHDDPKLELEFSLRIWVSVYAKFSATELLREIWGSTPIEAKPPESRRRESENMNLTSLQEELTKMMKSGRWRCLLVLDDVCNNESASASDLRRRTTWDEVLAPFKQHHSEKGSGILITSRAGICCKTLRADATIVLDGIDADAITLLLKKACFGDEHAAVPKKLQGLFHNQVLKTHGSPLAAEEVGCMLQGLDPAKWKDKLNSGYPDGFWRSHLSSYQDLPPHLQRCFAFCSIFPINWRFQPEKLIRMWVALGFVECSLSESGGKTTEDVAREYFHALLQRSFFKEAATVKGKSDSGFYVIHEHTHSMLRLVSPRTYLAIDANRDRRALIPLTVRHLSVTTSCLDQLKHSGERTKLRTLLVFNDDASTSPESPRVVTAIDNGVLKKFKGVRVLDFSDTPIAQLPESVGELKHLRYLDLPNTITKLGCHVTKLLLLQTFGVNKNDRFHELEDVPNEMSNLTNLRHLNLYMKCIEKIERIGRLDKLQGSVEFRAGKSEEGRGIRELEKLNSLRRMLSIKGLETVTSRNEAESAQLHKKEYLKILKLEWGQQTLQQQNQRGAATDDLAVLEGLEPHPNLEKLHIIRYLGTETPAWLENPSVLANLKALYLTNCRNLQVLPLVGVLPHLELLTIRELCSVRRIDSLFSSDAFSSLEKMEIYDMPMLDAWNEGVSNDTATLFPRLREVKIVHCPKLCSVSGLLSCRLSLVDLRVERCPEIKQTFSKSSFLLLNDFSKLLGCPELQFEDSPAEGAAAPRPTPDGGRCLVPRWYYLFIFVSICLFIFVWIILFHGNYVK